MVSCIAYVGVSAAEGSEMKIQDLFWEEANSNEAKQLEL